MKRVLMLAFALALACTSAPAPAQQTDYLTPEEITKVRDTQEPNKRIKLFLEFANDRLQRFETALAPAADQEALDPDALRDLLNDFISAVDDTAASVDLPLSRGGVDLRKVRKQVNEQVPDMLARLQRAQKSFPILSEDDLRYDLEDAVMATGDLLELGKRIPDEPIPPQQPVFVSADPDEKAPAGKRPTLKRREDEEDKKPR